MKNMILLITMLIFSVSLSTYADSKTDSPATTYINSQIAHVPSISAQQLRTMLASKTDKPVLVDVRTYYERNKTRTILGDKEIHIPRGFLEIKAWKTIPKDKPVIVYCGTGTRSKLAVKTLLDMGWTNVASLQGGIRAWYQSVNEPCGCLPDNKEIPDKNEKDVSQGCAP